MLGTLLPLGMLMPPEPGTRLGPYTIEALAGAGGMGEVYRARDTRLGRIVAIKVVGAALGARPDMRRRFQKDGQGLLWIRSFEGVAAEPLAGTDNGSAPFWSPDGRYLGFFTTDGKLKTINVTGGPPMTVCDGCRGKVRGAAAESSFLLLAGRELPCRGCRHLAVPRRQLQSSPETKSLTAVPNFFRTASTSFTMSFPPLTLPADRRTSLRSIRANILAE